MDTTRKLVLKEALLITVGVLICTGLMLGVYAIIGKFSLRVLFSALGGSAVIIINYFLLGVTVSLAADKAEAGDSKKAKNMIKLSSLVRLLLMGGLLLVGIKGGGDVIALVLPLLFLRPVLMLGEFFRKKGDK